MRSTFFLLLVYTTFTQAACAQSKQLQTISNIRFLDQYEIPFQYSFQETIVGGLSGIDYDSVRDLYYAISDDRGLHGPVRYYSIKIKIDSGKIKTAEFAGVTPLLQATGKPYLQDGVRHNPDAEAIRWNARTNELYWSSEGERILSGKKSVLHDPFINVAASDGKHKRSLALPKNLSMQEGENGPRQNSALEGLTFDRDFKTLYVALEEPLHEDGPRADTVPNGASVRLYKFDVTTGKNLAQYRYPLEPIAYPPSPRDKLRINGIAELLYAGPDKLITVERSFSYGRLPCTVRVFLSDLTTAENIADIKSIKERKVRPATKKLLLNMDSLGFYIDNIEGVTFGPTLSNGHRTILFVSDNNFNWFEKTQLLLFEVIP
jgi:hypothetical protein